MALASESVEITISTISISLRLQDSNEDRETDHAGSVLRKVNNFLGYLKIIDFETMFFKNRGNFGIFQKI